MSRAGKFRLHLWEHGPMSVTARSQDEALRWAFRHYWPPEGWLPGFINISSGCRTMAVDPVPILREIGAEVEIAGDLISVGRRRVTP